MKKQKEIDRESKLNLAAALVKAMPETEEQNALAIAAAMLTGFNLGKQAAQTA